MSCVWKRFVHSQNGRYKQSWSNYIPTVWCWTSKLYRNAVCDDGGEGGDLQTSHELSIGCCWWHTGKESQSQDASCAPNLLHGAMEASTFGRTYFVTDFEKNGVTKLPSSLLLLPGANVGQHGVLNKDGWINILVHRSNLLQFEVLPLNSVGWSKPAVEMPWNMENTCFLKWKRGKCSTSQNGEVPNAWLVMCWKDLGPSGKTPKQ